MGTFDVKIPTLEGWAGELVAQGYSPKTVKAKVSVVRLAAEWAGLEPHELTRDDVLGWIGSRERAAWTRRKYLEHVRTWCAWAGIPDATAAVKRPRQPVGIPRPVSEDALVAMLAAARPGRELAWIILGAYAGLRSFESAKVRHGDLRCPAGAWLLEVEGKGGQLAVVPAADIVVEQLELASAGVPPSARLWPGTTGRHVQSAVTAVAKRAGVECTSHQLRHRYGTMLYAGGRDLLMTQTLMRHASPATTAGYARVAPDAMAAAVAALPGASHAPGSATGTDGRRPRLYVVR